MTSPATPDGTGWRQSPLDVTLKLISRARQRGVGEVARLALERLREGAASEAQLIFLAREALSGSGPSASDLPVAPPGVEVRTAAPRDAVRYQRDVGTESARTFVRRLGPSGTCLLADDGTRILHATWVTRQAVWTRELRAYVRPSPGGAYVYESFTHSEARGRGLYPLVLGTAAAGLGTGGATRLWVAVEADNAASLRAVTKAGFTERFRVRYRRRLGRLHRDDPVGPGRDEASAILVMGRKGGGAPAQTAS